MYKFYNANAINRFEDDCVIRAISCATGKSWDYVYDYLSDIAQYEGTLFDKRDFVTEDSLKEHLSSTNKFIKVLIFLLVR